MNSISGAMVSVLASSGLSPGCVNPKTKIGISCFSTKFAALRRKSKDRVAWNQDNVSEWSDMSIRGLLFQ